MKSAPLTLTNNTINFPTTSTREVILYSVNVFAHNKLSNSSSANPLFYKVWQKVSRLSTMYRDQQVTSCTEVRSLRCSSTRSSALGSKQFLYTTLIRYSVNRQKNLNIVNTSELYHLFRKWGSLTMCNWTLGTLRAYRLLSFLFLNRMTYQFGASTPDVKTPLSQFPILKYL